MLQGTVLCANPLVCVYDDVFDAATAQAIIDLGTEDQHRAGVLEPLGVSETDHRTNTQSRIDQWASPLAAQLCTTVSSLVRLPPENCETAKILRYEGDQQFKPHHDGFATYLPASGEQLSNGGQRIFTTLCYLSDVDGDGGQTEFPALKISVRPKLGRVLLFSNTVPGTIEVHPHTLHAGRPLTSGVKWVMSLWWREQLYHVPRTYPEEDGDLTVI